MKKQFEIWLRVPEGCRLVGTRTEGETVICVFEKLAAQPAPPIPTPTEKRRIGFKQSPESTNKK